MKKIAAGALCLLLLLSGCGGFNLHWAWGTGLRAGRSAALGK